MKKHLKNKKKLTLSPSTTYMLQIQDLINFIYNNGELNWDCPIGEMNKLLSFKKIADRGSVFGIDVSDKDNETLIWGGVDYVKSAQYNNILSSDKHYATNQIIKKNKIKRNAFYNELFKFYDELSELDIEYGIVVSNNSIIKICSKFNQNTR